MPRDFSKEDLDDANHIGCFYLEGMMRLPGNKTVSFDDWSAKIIEDMGEDIKPYLNSIWIKAHQELCKGLLLNEYSKRSEQQETPIEKRIEPYVYDYDISGFARFFARVIVKQQVNKSFIGKSYLLYGQCFVIWSYFLKLGGILGAKYSNNLDAFGHAFLGAKGPSGAVKKYFTESAEILMTKYVSKSKTFVDYVGVEFINRINIGGYEDNALKFFTEHCKDKMKPEQAEWLAYLYAEQGAILGAVHPDLIKIMFSRIQVNVTNVPWTQEAVELACAANVPISDKQDLRSYEETEKDDNEMFMKYLLDICPDLYSILSK